MVVTLAKTGFRYPEEYDAPLYTYVFKKYGISVAPFGDMP